MTELQSQQGSSGASYVNTQDVFLGFPLSVGSLFIVEIVTSNPSAAAVSSITDSAGNTYQKAVGVQAISNCSLDIWYVKSTTAGPTQFTIHLASGRFDTVSFACREYSGGDQTNPSDVSFTFTENDYFNTHPTGNTQTLAQSNELVVAAYAYSSSGFTLTETSGGYGAVINQSNATQFTGLAVAYKNVTNGASQSATFDSGSNYLKGVLGIATFKAAGATTKTTTGVSRITAKTTKTTTGVSSIKKTVTKTTTGVSNLVKGTQKTLTGVSRIKATTTRTTTGVSNIFIAGTTQRTTLGKSRIQKATTRTTTGVSNITSNSNPTPAFYSPCANLADFTRVGQNAPSETVVIDATGGYDNNPAIKLTFGTAVTNEIDVVKEMLTSNIRYMKFKMKLASTTTGNQNGEHTLIHFWDYSTGAYVDLFQVRLRWNANAPTANKFQFLLRDGSTMQNSQLGTKLFSLNTYYDVEIIMTDYSLTVVVNGKVANEWFGKTYAGKYMNITAFGKFYSTNLTSTIWLDEVYLDVAQTHAAIPTSDLGKAQTLWESWKKRLVREDGAVVRPNPQGYLDNTFSPWSDVVSEGIGYGLMLAVQMNDQTTFDLIETWQFNNLRRAILGKTTGLNLMGWLFSDTTNTIIDPNWATDADVDRLKALYWAHAKWGSLGTINYKARGDALWADFKTYVFRTDGAIAIQPSDEFQAAATNVEMNMSYMDPAAYQTALRYNNTDTAIVAAATAGVYAILNGATSNSGVLATTTGLPCDWVGYNPSNSSINVTDNDSSIGLSGYSSPQNTPAHSVGFPPNNRAIKYSYDAFRTCARIYWDLLFNNSTAARTWLQGNIATFFQTTWNNFSQIGAEFQHNGAVIGETAPGVGYQASPMTWMAYLVLKAKGSATATDIYNNKVGPVALYYVDAVADYLGDNTNPSGPFRGKASYFSDSWNLMSYLTSFNAWTDISGPGASTKTTTGISRITAHTQKTTTGTARIRRTSTQTTTGVARVFKSPTTTQTIQGTARITAVGTQTITGKSRLTATTSRTTSGVTRVSQVTLQTTTGVSNISSATVTTTRKTTTGVANIANTTRKNTLGISRIGNRTTQTTTGTATILAYAAPIPPGFTVKVRNPNIRSDISN